MRLPFTALRDGNNTRKSLFVFTLVSAVINELFKLTRVSFVRRVVWRGK